MDGCFNGPATPFYLAHQHRALYGSDAKVSHPVLASMLGEASLCFLSDEERRELVAYDLKDQIEVLADELIVFGHVVADRTERAATSHGKALLQFHLRKKPLLQILPRSDFVIDRRAARPDCLQMGLENLMDKALLAFEVVIKLTLAASRGFNDFVRAGSAHSLLVEQVSGHRNDPLPCLCSSHKPGLHNAPFACTYKYSLDDGCTPLGLVTIVEYCT